jgi:hypothetical protein
MWGTRIVDYFGRRRWRIGVVKNRKLRKGKKSDFVYHLVKPLGRENCV